MVVDTPILLAVFFNEEHGAWAVRQLEKNKLSLRMSTVNLAETLILIKDRQPQLFEEIKDKIYASSIRFVPPPQTQAEIAAIARLKYPLNLGDCFAYALAKEENCPVLTLDKDFQKVDIPVILPKK